MQEDGEDRELLAEIGTRLARARQDAQLGQEDMARLVGRRVRSVQRWEKGAHELGATMLIRWSEVTGASILWLLLGQSTEDATRISRQALEAFLEQNRRQEAMLRRLLGDDAAQEE